MQKRRERALRSGGTCVTIYPIGERIRCIGGWQSYWYIDEYLCTFCGQLVEGEFVGEYVGFETTVRPSCEALKEQCFGCLMVAAWERSKKL